MFYEIFIQYTFYNKNIDFDILLSCRTCFSIYTA